MALKFLRLIDRQTPADKQLHLIVDNSPRKHPVVLPWAARHKRSHAHQQQLAQHGRTILPRPDRESAPARRLYKA
jgi:hypothetical protein